MSEAGRPDADERGGRRPGWPACDDVLAAGGGRRRSAPADVPPELRPAARGERPACSGFAGTCGLPTAPAHGTDAADEERRSTRNRRGAASAASGPPRAGPGRPSASSTWRTTPGWAATWP